MMLPRLVRLLLLLLLLLPPRDNLLLSLIVVPPRDNLLLSLIVVSNPSKLCPVSSKDTPSPSLKSDMLSLSVSLSVPLSVPLSAPSSSEWYWWSSFSCFTCRRAFRNSAMLAVMLKSVVSNLRSCGKVYLKRMKDYQLILIG
jgi:hypothetical protein